MIPKHTLTLTTYLQSTKAPWTILLIINTGQRAESLVHAPDGYVLRVIKGAKCQTTAGLLTEFARALDFPDYFGHNWDALEECLADLEWLPAKGYFLLIADAAQVLRDDEEYETFLRSCAMRERPGGTDRREWARDKRRHFTCCSLYRNERKPSGPAGG